MTTVWLASSGSYSDYHVVGVYSTQDLAKLAVAHDRYGNDPEAFELDDRADLLQRGYSQWTVQMDRDGTSRVRACDGYSDDDLSLRTSYPSKTRVLAGDVWARDEQHAVKIANERRAQLIAADEWPAGGGEG